METFIVRLEGQELCRISGEGITCGKKVVYERDSFKQETIDDMKLLKIVRDGNPLVVWYISSSAKVTVEKVNE